MLVGNNREYFKGVQMKDIERLRVFAIECGLPEDIIVDEKTLILSSAAKEIGSLKEEQGVDYYVNLDYPSKVQGKPRQSNNGFNIYTYENGVFIVDANKRLAMVASIYELYNVHVHGNIISITGHEKTATVILDDLTESFSYHTR